ncbi:hypothetical protein VNO78_24105 [Psophocarpus tetragonolobus]|uniref:Uncharacterized protein n=1 Tax=Psophocarpus tetragonolobus TaxID=3891 RepID=A0AAN9S7X0_PSOTE
MERKVRSGACVSLPNDESGVAVRVSAPLSFALLFRSHSLTLTQTSLFPHHYNNPSSTLFSDRMDTRRNFKFRPLSG